MQTLKKFKKIVAVIALLLLITLSVALPVKTSLADVCEPSCDNGASATPPPPPNATANDPNCSDSSNAGIANCLKTNKLVKDLNLIVDFLSAAVGIAVVGSLIAGGIQYSMASGNANSTQAARQRITNALIALFAFVFIFAFLQWLIPGGL